MQTSTDRRITYVFFLLMFAIIASAGTRSAIQASSNVVVTNATTQPVPVAIQGTPTVKATPNGTFPVSVTGTPTVKAVQSGSFIVAVANAPQVRVPNFPGYSSAWQHTFHADIANGSYFSNSDYWYVPSGKRLIVEHLSVFSYSDVGGNYANFGSVNNFGAGGSIYAVVNPLFGSSVNSIGNQEGQLILEAGDPLEFTAQREASNTNGVAHVTAHISGHLVSYP
jgi:hypothetical protein